VALRGSGGRACTFQENTVTEAAEELAREGLWQEYSGAAGLAALREAIIAGEQFEEPIVAILTSTGLKEVPATPIFSESETSLSLERVLAPLRNT
jgi:threonine synthase